MDNSAIEGRLNRVERMGSSGWVERISRRSKVAVDPVETIWSCDAVAMSITNGGWGAALEWGEGELPVH